MRYLIFISTALACLALSATRPALAQTSVNQTTSQEAAKKLNDSGSDDSIKGAVTNGMRALTNLNDLNIPGAIHNGLKAYGQYRNSEELDKLKNKNQDLKSRMGSGISATDKNITYVSPFARLPKNFLYEGEAGKLAAQVEKMSGVSRGELLTKVTNMEARSKREPDSSWVSWTLKSTGEFADSMPNKNFREALQKAHSLAANVVENGTLKSLIAKFQGSSESEAKAALAAAAKPSANSAGAVHSKNSESKANSSASPASSPKAITGTSLAATSSPPAKSIPTSDGGIHQLETKDAFMDQLVNTAVNTKEATPPSIFEIVSEKIRQLDARQGLSPRP
ncbi:MAG: hypothetical protein ACXWQO_01290 [Bdellovibrionota bacterium]